MISVLAIGSHPDDMEIGCFGILGNFVHKKANVYLLVLTNGEAGGDPVIRKREMVKSAQTIGAKELFWGGYKDTKLSKYDNVLDKIESVIKKTRPQYVFVNFGKDTHQDHRYANQCTLAASRNVANVLLYEGPTTYKFSPNVYSNIVGSFRDKLACLKCHKSQVMRTNIDNCSILKIAEAMAIFRGTQCLLPKAEAFVSLRMVDSDNSVFKFATADSAGNPKRANSGLLLF